MEAHLDNQRLGHPFTELAAPLAAYGLAVVGLAVVVGFTLVGAVIFALGFAPLIVCWLEGKRRFAWILVAVPLASLMFSLYREDCSRLNEAEEAADAMLCAAGLGTGRTTVPWRS